MRFLLRFLFLGMPVLGWAQSLSGRVTSAEDATPLAGTTLRISRLHTSAPLQGTVSDATGSFSFTGIPLGTYVLTASFVGYLPRTETVQIGRTPIILPIALTPSNLSDQQVVVTANRAEAAVNPITFSNLTAEDLSKRPTTRDIPQMLSELPSATYYSENGNNIGYAYLRMRGFDQRRIAVMMNGIPQNDAEDHNVYWINFFDQQDAITDIQVQRGASASFYGSSGIGGAINIIANPYREKAFAQADIGYGSFNTQRYGLTLNSGKSKRNNVFYGRLSRVKSDGYRENSWTEFWRYFAGMTHYGPQSVLTIQTWGGPQRDGLAYYGIAKEDNADPVKRRANYSAAFNEVESFQQPHVEVLYNRTLSTILTMSQKVYGFFGMGYFDFDATWRTPDYMRLPAGWQNLTEADRALDFYTISPNTSVFQRAYVGNRDLGWLPSFTWKTRHAETTLGAEFRLHRSRHWGRIQDATNDIPSDWVGDDAPHVYDYRTGKWISALYATHARQVSPKLRLQADVQASYLRYQMLEEQYFNHRFNTPFLFVNPRVGLTYQVSEAWSWYGSTALSNREPRFKELYDAEEAGAGSSPKFEVNGMATDYTRPLVKPEHLLNAELGLMRQTARWRLRINGYWMQFRDEIIPSGGLDQFGVPRYGNANQTSHLGVETELHWAWSQHWSLATNGSWGRHELVQFTEYDGDGQPLVRDGNPIAGFPQLTANARLQYVTGGFTGALTAQHVGKFCVDNSGCPSADPTAYNDAFTVLNANFQFAPTGSSSGFWRGIKVQLDVQNVLNQRVLLHGNEDRSFFPLATRNIFLTITYRTGW